MCGEIDKEENIIKVKVERRKYGRTVTLIEGVESADTKTYLNDLKSKCACGGTKKKDFEGNDLIVLQGDHRSTVKNYLLKLGITDSNILVQ